MPSATAASSALNPSKCSATVPIEYVITPACSSLTASTNGSHATAIAINATQRPTLSKRPAKYTIGEPASSSTIIHANVGIALIIATCSLLIASPSCRQYD